MNWRIVRTLVVKDLTLYFRNRFFAFVSVLALVAYAALYFLLPRTVDETLEIGIYAPAIPPALARLMEEEGLSLQMMDSEEALKQALIDGRFEVGVVLPPDLAALATGQKAQVHVYLTAGVPQEYKDMYAIVFQELAFTMSGQPLNLQISEEILGPDMAGAQIPPRDRMRPLFAVFVLLMETLGLASLISSEVVGGTLQALLITPLRVEGLFAGKGIMGVGLAFVQAALLMAIIGGLGHQPILILVALLLGALLATGLAFMIASAARDMMSVMSWGILAILILIIPALGVLLPGTISNWVRIIPSYYLVDTVYRATDLGIGWSQAWPNLLILLACAGAAFALGIVLLRRKFE
jgi:ABC-2 type transport system permease protein